MDIKELVLFKDTLEDNAEPHFGFLLNDNTILCFCCGGIIEEDDYKIIKHFHSTKIADDMLQAYYANKQ